tara:strand:- start:128 stop:358 length:231 start_codon:yes stop_codon:yes gene_type:complete
MRFVEFANSHNVVITNEEQDILQQVINDGSIEKKKFSERDAQIANQLVNKDLLLRKKVDDQITYSPQPRTKNITVS